MAGSDRVEDLVARFESMILAGTLAPGDALPAERRIVEEHGVSRGVVREAVSRLVALGLVRSVHGSGNIVAPAGAGPVTRGLARLLAQGGTDLAKLAEVRLPLETAIARLAAERRSAEDLHALEQAQRLLGRPSATLEQQVQADVAFHGLLAAASGNPLFGVVLAPMQELLIAGRRRTLGRHGAALAYDHHARILDAVRARDGHAAFRAMEEHLRANAAHLSEPPPISG